MWFSFACTCDAGFVLDDRRCIDIDECAEGIMLNEKETHLVSDFSRFTVSSKNG